MLAFVISLLIIDARKNDIFRVSQDVLKIKQKRFSRPISKSGMYPQINPVFQVMNIIRLTRRIFSQGGEPPKMP